jgi:hypothetical protein
MTRRTAEVTATDGRDAGKKFLITEMDASRAEDWGLRALGAMSRSGVDMSPSIMSMGMAGFAMLGLKAFISAPFDEARPLLAEMFECVQRVEEKATRALVENDTEEVSTRLFLRDEVLKLHVNFSILARVSEGVSQLGKILTAIDTSNIPTSQDESGLSSAPN